MDGLLINTEDMYTEVHSSILIENGKGPLPWSEKIKLQGLPGLVAAKTLLSWSQLPYTPEEYYAMTGARLAKLFPTAKFLPGALELLQYLKDNDIPIALATSSHSKALEMKTGHLQENGFELFGDHVVTGDDPRIPPGRGKPHPDIWQVALESLNNCLKNQAAEKKEEFVPIKPEECLVFEDGIPGLTGAKVMGATVIWVPHKLAAEVLGQDELKKHIDGHGEVLGSLEHFDKEKYF